METSIEPSRREVTTDSEQDAAGFDDRRGQTFHPARHQFLSVPGIDVFIVANPGI